ncbi:GIN domain-containing protein [Aquimarina sp. 2201CG5-10]|uniref:GIN domain-containing protein n=1 Tax=Aquimarina callyspongiae TaxID=3098150 RepID=UPI002AB4750F|nr:DUF2807 domain-containing protein [Aquimarina sp. 2201CG5-10]MDY8137425.1 DUF2807 domain-containing protein [Aquimarina sp. 2201CG5-10]
MRAFLILLLSISVTGNSLAQIQKVKGNKIVMTEEKIVEGFHTIELYNNFEVSLEEDSDSYVKIEADSNLQEYIDVEVQDSILIIKTDKVFRRAKALNISIHYGSELKKIKTYDKVNLKSLSPIKSSEIIIESNNESETFLTIDTGKLSSISNGKSETELHATASEISYQVNENSDLTGIVTTDSLKVDIYQKGYVKLEGEAKSMLSRIDGNTKFYGQKLSTGKTNLIAEGSSECYLLVNDLIEIDAQETAKIYLLGEPKITITRFSNEVTLYKKNLDYNPNRLKL